MYLEGDGSQHTQKAELMYIANSMNPGLRCMQFWYSMRGSNVGKLNIYIITEVSEQLPVWTKSGTQGPIWNLGKVEFNCSTTFKVITTETNFKHYLPNLSDYDQYVKELK